jgi:hypothetical protein
MPPGELTVAEVLMIAVGPSSARVINSSFARRFTASFMLKNEPQVRNGQAEALNEATASAA